MSPVNIVVTGGNGQLGQALQSAASVFPHLQFSFLGRHELDITSNSRVSEYFEQQPADYVIHAAAYTAVDKAEQEEELCMLTNVDGSRHIAHALQKSGGKLIYISSDYVYHTYNGFPLAEDSDTEPKGVYARSKLLGEREVQTAGIPAMVIRASWVVSPYGHNFVKTILRLGRERDQLSIVNDQFGCLTSADDLAMVILHIIQNDTAGSLDPETFSTVYNYSNEGCITWYDIAKRITDVCSLPCRIIPIETKDYPTAAIRPGWSVMSKKKCHLSLGLDVPHWLPSLDAILNRLI